MFLFSAEEGCIPFHMKNFQIQHCVLPGDLPAPHAWYGDLLPADGAPSLAGGQGDHGDILPQSALLKSRQNKKRVSLEYLCFLRT